METKSFYPGPPLYIFKKSILIENRVRFSSIRYEDEEFSPKLFLYAGKTYISKEVYFKRRVRPGSTMQINRNFDDIFGYIKNIESLNNIKSKLKLKSETRKLLDKRIINFVREIIIAKSTNKIIMNSEQKKILWHSIKPFIFSDKSMLIFYYTYPLEYKLRKIKKELFG